jgi:hypothetical protein
MKLTRMPAGLTSEERFAFYASKVALINAELHLIASHWQRCTEKENNIDIRFDGKRLGATCLRAAVPLCEACQNNKAVYGEKRKLKAQFSKAVEALRMNVPKSNVLCKKEEPSFTDLNECKYYEAGEWN